MKALNTEKDVDFLQNLADYFKKEKIDLRNLHVDKMVEGAKFFLDDIEKKGII